jgi:hypothetical protein
VGSISDTGFEPAQLLEFSSGRVGGFAPMAPAPT